jgi:hypothetical protein
MKRTELVAVGITEVSQIRLTTKPWRIFDRCAAMRDTSFVPSFGLFWGCHRQTDRASVGVSGCLPIDGLAHHQHAAVVHVAQAPLGVLFPRLTADRCEQGIVEFLRPVDVAAGDHHMTEHFVFPPTAIEASASAPGIDHAQPSGKTARWTDGSKPSVEIGTLVPLVAYPPMRKRRSSSPFALPMMMARLTAASLETIFHRTAMMAKGTCSPAEYQRMVAEKAAAAQRSMVALMTGKSLTAALVPYSSRARANAKRLRKK